MDIYLGYAALFLGVVYVLLAARSNVWCWLAGIVSSLLQIYINIHSHFYQDVILQGYYVVAGFYGWWLWSKTELQTEESIISYSIRQCSLLVLLGAVLVPIFGFIFSKFGNSLSYFDATVTVFSFIATWMTIKRIIQNWLFWIPINVVATVMYFIKAQYPLSMLYVIYALAAIYGYYEWRKQMKLA